MEFLDKINANENLVTLISKKAIDAQDPISYLQVGVTAKAREYIESKKQKLNEMMEEFAWGSITFGEGDVPDENPPSMPESQLQILRDPVEYCRVDRFMFYIVDPEELMHEMFWHQLTTFLETVK